MANAPTLLVLAAGMGSRYGGLKQMDPMGPNGELIIDYSIYDARRAGFDKLVFVVRPEIEDDFREIVASRFADQFEISFVHQCLDDLPDGIAVPAERQKPWGTGHAILVAEDAIQTPFCVINGDDFYGPGAFRMMGDFLRQQAAPELYGMVAYMLRNTLSDHGSVARGICEVSADNRLLSVTERLGIERHGEAARFEDGGSWHSLTGDELVSLNFWGFHPAIFGHLREQFRDFLAQRREEPKAEFFIPSVVDSLIRQQQAEVAVMASRDSWFGVTYPQDKAIVQENLRRLIAENVYPESLWG